MESISASTSSTSSSKYVKDFESLFVPINKHLLREKARDGKLRHCQFRSICWRYFLRCLPENFNLWLECCEKNRALYEEIRTRHQLEKSEAKDKSSTPIQVVNNFKVDLSNSTTTTLDDSTKKKEDESDDEQQYSKAADDCDHKDLFRTIQRDVVRTFPDMEFFRRTEIQSILENVLFNYASENTHISYKQGMHELLATLLYVLHTDSQNCLINYEGGYANELIGSLLNLKYLEHDVFHTFCALMKSIETWYQNDEILMTPDTFSGSRKDSNAQSSGQVSSVLSIKLKMISEAIVKIFDVELFNHLEALQIAPQIYGIRWMRLLFGREFEFLDLLTVWDAIICDLVSMSLTDYIFASMLITIREELVNGDYTDCLNNLMRYQFKDVQYVIKLALHLRDPDNNGRPKAPRASFQKTTSHNSHRRYTPETSLRDKLSQQYLKDKYLQNSGQSKHLSNTSSLTSAKTGVNRNVSSRKDSTKRSVQLQTNPTTSDNRDSRKIFSMTSASTQRFHDRQNLDNRTVSRSSTASGKSAGPVQASSNKFLPNINRLVSTIGQNIQDMAGQPIVLQSANLTAPQRLEVKSDGRLPYGQKEAEEMAFRPSYIREFEMREMPPSANSLSINRGKNRFPTASIGDATKALNLSTESYDDLHSIVDYCWRLLSEQIDSLQRCLPKEKSLHSEDEIFVALAQLKKVRDVLKGSLRLEDELESPPQGQP